MSIYRFSKSGRLFVQGTHEDDDRSNVIPSSRTGSPSGDDLQAIYTKRRLSTEVLGRLVQCFSFNDSLKFRSKDRDREF